MRRTWSNYFFLLIVAVFLAACGAEESPAPTEQAAAPEVVAEETATSSPEPTATATETPTPTETVAPTPTTEPTATAEVVAETSDECLACHSDKEQLIETAAPEEKVPSESSGVG
jgi:hypothetical protein